MSQARTSWAAVTNFAAAYSTEDIALAKAADTSGVGTKQKSFDSSDDGIAIATTDIMATHNIVRRTMREAVGKHITGNDQKVVGPRQPMTWLNWYKVVCY